MLAEICVRISIVCHLLSSVIGLLRMRTNLREIPHNDQSMKEDPISKLEAGDSAPAAAESPNKLLADLIPRTAQVCFYGSVVELLFWLATFILSLFQHSDKDRLIGMGC